MKYVKRLVVGVLAMGLFIPVLTCKSSPVGGGSWDSVPPLKGIYPQDEYFLMGNIISPGDIGTQRFDILKYHFNTLTAENHMKPDFIAPGSSGGAYRYENADKIVDAAIAAGFKMHGHTLIWHSQTPTWLSSGGESGMTQYINDVMEHFKGKVFSWDVVNEAFRDDLGSANPANWKSCLRTDSGWYKSVGADYIETAFRAARAADPDAKLYYNDYALNWNLNNNNANKAQAVYFMVKDINERYPDVGGRPLIDGIGMQSHHHLNTDPATIGKSIEQFSSLNVDITISELDIVSADGNGISGFGAWNDGAAQKQAKHYAAMFKIFKEHKDKISRVTFWGIDDGTSWRKETHPVLLDGAYNLKPAFYAVLDPDGY